MTSSLPTGCPFSMDLVPMLILGASSWSFSKKERDNVLILHFSQLLWIRMLASPLVRRMRTLAATLAILDFSLDGTVVSISMGFAR